VSKAEESPVGSILTRNKASIGFVTTIPPWRAKARRASLDTLGSLLSTLIASLPSSLRIKVSSSIVLEKIDCEAKKDEIRQISESRVDRINEK
jgi:hypothetical protein